MHGGTQTGVWLTIDSVALFLRLPFVSITMLLEPNWIGIDSYLGNQLNVSFNYVLGIIAVMFVPFAYLLWRILRLARPVIRGEVRAQALVNQILRLVLLVSYVAVLMLLVVLWSDDGVLVLRALEYPSTALFLVLDYTTPSLRTRSSTGRDYLDTVVSSVSR